MANVVNLIFYPVKGCAGTSMSDALLTPAGLAHDRSFMVISEDGIFPGLSSSGTAVGAEIDHGWCSAIA